MAQTKREGFPTSNKKAKPFRPLAIKEDGEKRITLEGWNHYSDDEDDDYYNDTPQRLSTSFQECKKPTTGPPKKLPPQKIIENKLKEKAFNESCINHQFIQSQREENYEVSADEVVQEDIDGIANKSGLTTPYSISNHRINGPIRGSVKLRPVSKSIEPNNKEKNCNISYLNPIQKKMQGMMFNKRAVPLQIFSLEKTQRNSQDEDKSEQFITTRVQQSPQGQQSIHSSQHEKSLNLPRIENFFSKLEEAAEGQSNSILDVILNRHPVKKETKPINNSIIDLNMTRHGSIQGLGPQGKLKNLLKDMPQPNTLLVLKKKHAFNKAIGIHGETPNKTPSKDTTRSSNRTPSKCHNIPVAIRPQMIRFMKPLHTVKPQKQQIKLPQVLENISSAVEDKTSIQNILKKNKIDNNKLRPGSGEDLNGVVKLLLDYNTQAYKAQLNHSMVAEQSKSILEPSLNKYEWEQARGMSSFRINEDSGNKKRLIAN